MSNIINRFFRRRKPATPADPVEQAVEQQAAETRAETAEIMQNEVIIEQQVQQVQNVEQEILQMVRLILTEIQAATTKNAP